jgi:hypothetical protein
MHKNAMKCNKTLSKWCKTKHGASKIIDTFETYQDPSYLCPLQTLEKNLPSQSMTKVRKHDAEEAEFAVVERTA